LSLDKHKEVALKLLVYLSTLQLFAGLNANEVYVKVSLYKFEGMLK